MVRNRTTIERRLKKINADLFYHGDPKRGILWRWLHRQKIYELNVASYALAWALNKVEHDTRGDQRIAKN